MQYKFYTVYQNNSGGHFLINKPDGIAILVSIEASSASDANRRLKEITTNYSEYCDCCGERWDYFDEEDGTNIPSYYDKPILDLIISKRDPFIKNAAIHFVNGAIEWLYANIVDDILLENKDGDNNEKLQ